MRVLLSCVPARAQVSRTLDAEAATRVYSLQHRRMPLLVRACPRHQGTGRQGPDESPFDGSGSTLSRRSANARLHLWLRYPALDEATGRRRPSLREGFDQRADGGRVAYPTLWLTLSSLHGADSVEDPDGASSFVRTEQKAPWGPGAATATALLARESRLFSGRAELPSGIGGRGVLVRSQVT